MTLLFAGILLFGVPHLASILAPSATRGLKADLRGVVVGAMLYLLFAFAFDPYVVGVRVMP